MLLAGDVGGTKTRLALYEDTPTPIFEEVYSSDDYETLTAIVQTFLSETEQTATRAVFGVPGPIMDGEVKVTNLPWTIREDDLVTTLKLDSCKLLNDLEATAYGIPFLPDEDLVNIHAGDPHPRSNKVVIAPGTGLGEAILFHHDGKFYASASEGGHTTFAPRTTFEIKLLEYLMGKFGHVSYERVCSGIGIPHIYNFLTENETRHEIPELKAKIEAAEDPVPLIVTAALNYESEICRETLEAFVSILASESANMALNVLAHGGVYLGGGIPPKILPALTDGNFEAAFLDKGRFSGMMTKIPVYVIKNEKTALFGAACYALGW